MLLRCGKFEFTFPRPALVMGIVNVTPDSFSDGGQFLERDAAVAQALKLVEEGADIIDIGGESTRPGATPVLEAEELRRVLPVIDQLAGRLSIPISIDTMKPNVARAAISAGASIVNDVGANRDDEQMWQAVSTSGAGYVVMHMQGTPQTMQELFWASLLLAVTGGRPRLYCKHPSPASVPFRARRIPCKQGIQRARNGNRLRQVSE